MLLSSLLLSPILGILCIYLSKTALTAYRVSLYTSALYFVLTLYSWLAYQSADTNGLLHENPFLVNYFSSLTFGLDKLSICFIVLTGLFLFLCILSLSPNQARVKEVLYNLYLLTFGIVGAFTVLDLLGFFVFFELTLIPIFFIVLVWGSRGRKVRASYLIGIYTLLGSIFMLVTILYVYHVAGVTSYMDLLQYNFSDEEQKVLWILFFIAFAAKIPLFPLHIWLPEAHVEAPTIGSVLLAALLLKLGIYGLLRFNLVLFPVGTLYYQPLVAVFALCGILYTSFTAIRQTDMKKIIAYSSVGHMNVVLLGAMSQQIEGIDGCIIQMLSHGVVSGALFFGVGVLYSRTRSRYLKYFGGVAFQAPLFAVIFLLFSVSNISFPGTSSFVGEFLIFVGILKDNFLLAVLAALSMITSTVYAMFLYNRVFFGNFRTTYLLNGFLDLSAKELSLFGILIYFLFVIGLAPSVLF